MKYFRILCYVIAASQFALGALYLFVPQSFVAWQGLSAVGTDINYPLAMLAGRFIVYGAGMIAIARDPAGNRFWAYGMAAIQGIDLGAGIFYTATGVVPLADSFFPMFDATLFMVALLVLLRRPDVSNPARA